MDDKRNTAIRGHMVQIRQHLNWIDRLMSGQDGQSGNEMMGVEAGPLELPPGSESENRPPLKELGWSDWSRSGPSRHGKR
jgi:hypothetical protein